MMQKIPLFSILVDDATIQAWLNLAKQTLRIEMASIESALYRIDQNTAFVDAVATILQSTGRVVVMGIGKSGHVGNKIAATLASTGTPAFFVHPAEANHGDLGMITAADLVLAISNSGESQEIVSLLPLVKRMGAKLVVMSGNAHSTMARQADVFIDTHVEKEACPLNLAPTASTAVQMALGDALAMCVLDAKGFKSEDFAKSHPGGALGRRLLTHVSDVMRTGKDIPQVPMHASFAEVVNEISSKGMGITAIVDEAFHVKGVFSDGDLCRLIESGRADIFQQTAYMLMNTQPKTISPQALAADAALIMEKSCINCVLVVNEHNVLQGAVSSNDLMRAKVI